jgi:adenosylcobinamide kinase/adenosylcobinamide-phosphate guanylyltransferase
LVLGGARSGKSRYAEALVARHPGARLYIATAEAGDAEMAERIRRHQAERGAGWRTIEAPLDLVAALEAHARPGAPILVDCLTLWLSNLMGAGRDVERASDGLVAWLRTAPCPIVLVSNEVGFGIVPDNEVARRFRDHVGRLNQIIASLADCAVLIAAGLPLVLKGDGALASSERDAPAAIRTISERWA